jgi:hypothetical protein
VTGLNAVPIGPFVGGLNTFSDETSVADNELVECLNFELDLDGSLKSRPPFADYAIDFTLQATGNVEYLGYYYSSAGASFLIASDGLSKTYYFDGSAWTLITSTFAASAMAQFNGKAWLTAPVGSTNPGGSWDGATFTAEPNMARGDVIVTHKDRLWIAVGKNAPTNSARIYYSNTIVDTAGLWPATPNFMDVGAGDGQAVVTLLVNYNSLLILRTNSVWSFQYTSTVSSGIQSLLVPKVGVADKRSVAQFESYVYWIYEDRAYEFINSRATQINMKVPLATTATKSNYYAPFAVSEFNRRIIFSFYDTMYVFNLKTRTWTTWKTAVYGGVGRIVKQEGAPTVQAVAHSNVTVPGGGVRKAKTLLIKDELGTATENIDLVIQTKNYNYQASSSLKRLFWWGVDATFQGTVTGTAEPINYNFSTSWNSLFTQGYTWHSRLPFTWAHPTSNSIAVTETRSTAGLQTGRKFIKFPKGLRFRQINFRLEFTSDGTADSFVRLFSLSTFVKPKERVSKTLS